MSVIVFRLLAPKRRVKSFYSAVEDVCLRQYDERVSLSVVAWESNLC